MADHIDKQILDAAVTLLTGLTTTGNNVFPDRVDPLQDAELPALSLYVDDSEVREGTIGGANRLQDRTITLTVLFSGKAVSSYGTQSHASKKEVEIAIGNSNTIGNTVKYAQLRRIHTDRDGAAEKKIITTELTFECEAITAMNAPDVSL